MWLKVTKEYKGNHASGCAFEAVLEFLLEQEPWVAGEVTHFDVILKCELHDAVAGGFAKARVFGQDVVPVFVRIDQPVEHRAIFHAAVHALPVEGHNGVGRVSHQGHLVAVVPGLHRIITSDEVGWVFQSSVRLGSKGTTSGKCVLKNRCTLSSSVKESKPSGPS